MKACLEPKHFLHDPTHLVHTALSSLPLLNPSLLLDSANKTIYLRPLPASPATVSLLSGGGSGHEPSFSSFVGQGLLTAAVAGTIFASPSAAQVRHALLHRVPREKGVLVVVMNYTGDVLNFGMGVEKARALGLQVEMVVVGDDVGVGRGQGGKVGRRGIAGTCLVLKIAAAAAEKGGSLEEVRRVAETVAANLVSIGASLAHVHVPGREKGEGDEDGVAEGEVEVGMGIHNEPGSERKTADLVALVQTMLKHLLDQSDEDRAFLNISGEDETVLLVNNLGGVSVLEMSGIVAVVLGQLEGDWNIKPVRILAGTFMTSLNGMGFSISLLKIADLGLGGLGLSMLELLDAPAEALGWSAPVSTSTWKRREETGKEEQITMTEEAKPSNLQLDSEFAKRILNAGLQRLIKAEPEVTRYDTVVGDGDCGTGLKRGAEAIATLLENKQVPGDAAIFLDRITQEVESHMDGTSGALYAIFLNALAYGLRTQSSSSPIPVTIQTWSKALQSSLESLSKYTPAKPGDRTLMDALHPFIETLSKTSDIKSAAESAAEGAQKTKGMRAKLGRTVYVGGEGWQEVPDPGAYGLSEFLLGLSEAF
ncbi:dihydroxyacetone kinase [Patellaria atrata CBS 101060]|uniref:Dihydroxyacetone kinase n=1 Tax=Patellaria atrata CBS 101060 TaxID=1346257 RepID=A0A9P4VM96_9PEZI|nr:dihydroxyacetone kinase [Patellaria atrata CBS 101060]